MIGIYNAENDTITQLAGNSKVPVWTGTTAEFEALDKSTLQHGTYLNITDDETNIIDDTEAGISKTYSSNKIESIMTYHLNKVYVQPSSSAEGRKIMTIKMKQNGGACYTTIEAQRTRINDDLLLSFKAIFDNWGTEPYIAYKYVKSGCNMPTITRSGMIITIDWSDCGTGAIGCLVENAESVVIS